MKMAFTFTNKSLDLGWWHVWGDRHWKLNCYSKTRCWTPLLSIVYFLVFFVSSYRVSMYRVRKLQNPCPSLLRLGLVEYFRSNDWNICNKNIVPTFRIIILSNAELFDRRICSCVQKQTFAVFIFCRHTYYWTQCSRKYFTCFLRGIHQRSRNAWYCVS